MFVWKEKQHRRSIKENEEEAKKKKEKREAKKNKSISTIKENLSSFLRLRQFCVIWIYSVWDSSFCEKQCNNGTTTSNNIIEITIQRTETFIGCHVNGTKFAYCIKYRSDKYYRRSRFPRAQVIYVRDAFNDNIDFIRYWYVELLNGGNSIGLVCQYSLDSDIS